MWRNYKLYLLAFIIYSLATVGLAVLELAVIRYAETAILARVATMLSGGFLGGFALVLGILRDDRFEKERRRAEKAEAAIADWQKQAAETEKRAAENAKQATDWQKRVAVAEKRAEQAEQARQEAEQRQERASAELQRVRAEYSRELADRVRRLEAAVGIAPVGVADDARSDRQSEQ